jgi:hypothetical protein
MTLTTTATPNTTEDTSALLRPPKTPKVYRTEFATAYRACRTAAEREQLAEVIQAGWREAELTEFSRLHYFRNGKDYPTAVSFREAVADILTYGDALSWRKQFRKDGSKPLPPRPKRLLVRGRGFMTGGLTSADYSWHGHTEEFRSMIEERCRAYFKNMPPDQPVPVNAWAASLRWYEREQAAPALRAAAAKAAATEVARIAREAVTLVLSPKAKRRSSGRADREDAAAFEYCSWGYRKPPPIFSIAQLRAPLPPGYRCPPLELIGKLKPHFSYHFAGHTAAFREEVAALARKDLNLRPNASISPTRWKASCHKNFVLIERPQA